MKKLTVLTLFLFCAIASFSQGFPNNQSASNDHTLFSYGGGLKANVGFVNTRYSDTTAANLTYIAHVPGGQIIVGNTVYIRDVTTVKWIEIGSSGTVIVGGDTTYVQLPLYVDTTGGIRTLKIFHQDGYEGGIVTYTGTGFDFNVSPITLYLNNKVFLFPETTLTLSPPNSQPRYDIFGVDSLGAFVKSGDSAALPIEPQVGVDSFALTKAFLISPGDTAPSNITTGTIYDQNTEWVTGTQASPSVVDFDNTDNPFHLTKDIFISKYTNNAQIYFVNGSYERIANTPQSVLLLPIYLNGALSSSNNIYINLYDTLAYSTNLYRLGSNDNFDKNKVNSYQTVVIPTNNFTWVNNKSTFTTLLVTFTGYDTSGAKGLYMDYIRLQNGIFNLPSPTDYSNKQDSNYKRNDSLFWVAKGIEHFITKVGTCDTCISTVNISADSTLLYFIRVNGDTARAVDFYGSGGGSGGITQSQLDDSTASAKAFSWNLNGNGGTNPAINFLGTTDNNPIVFKSFGGVRSGFIGGGNSTAIGYDAYSYDTATINGNSYNTAFGARSLHSLLRGSTTVNAANVAIGYNALGNTKYGHHNVAVGTFTMTQNTPTSDDSFRSNTAIGAVALSGLANGIGNVAIGDSSLLNLNTGSYNISIGQKSAFGQTTLNNTLIISDSTYHLQMKLDSATGTAPSVIGKDALGYWHTYATPSGGGGTYTASNGLTMTSNNVKLGGGLTGATTINSFGNSLTINGGSVAGALQSTTTNGIAFVATATTTGLPISGASVDAAVIDLRRTPTSTNTIVPIAVLTRFTTGTAANGIGQSIHFDLQTSASAYTANEIVSKWTDATIATRTSEFSITGVNSATTNTLFTLSGNGSTKLNKYGSGTFTGTPTYNLAVNSSGDIIEVASGGSGSTYYANNGLTKVTGDTMQLGGTLTSPVLITSSTAQPFEVSNLGSFNAVVGDPLGAYTGVKINVSNEGFFTSSDNAGTLASVKVGIGAGTDAQSVSLSARNGVSGNISSINITESNVRLSIHGADAVVVGNGGSVQLTQGAPEYTDNAAAVSAGLVTGTVYRTGDNLKIVH